MPSNFDEKNAIVFWGQYHGIFETMFFPLRFEGTSYNSVFALSGFFLLPIWNLNSLCSCCIVTCFIISNCRTYETKSTKFQLKIHELLYTSFAFILSLMQDKIETSGNCHLSIYGQNTQKPPVWKNRGSKEKKSRDPNMIQKCSCITSGS